MSLLDCDIHGDTARGKLLGFYMTVLRDGIRLHRRLKVCEHCLDELVKAYGSEWSDGFILNRFTASSVCHKCRAERGAGGTLHPMYVTCYNGKGTRFDYYATYCPSCAGVFIDTFELKESVNGKAS